MSERIVVLHEDDLRSLLQEAAAAALQGLALTLSGGAAAAAAAASVRRVQAKVSELTHVNGGAPLALAAPKKKGRPKGSKSKSESKRNMAAPDAPGDWITPAEGARLLGVSDASLYFAINSGKFLVKTSDKGSLLVERNQIRRYAREQSGNTAKRQKASKKGTPRGVRGTDGPAETSPGWLSLSETSRLLGNMSVAAIKLRREKGLLKTRRAPGQSGPKAHFQYETASVLALAEKTKAAGSKRGAGLD